MITIEHIETQGWEPAIRGMRNPKNSWNRNDSFWCDGNEDSGICYSCEYWQDGEGCTNERREDEQHYTLGDNDYELATRLANAGQVHGKFLRMITVYMDITAPLYWWKEFDTYKVGTVADSCSTMHKIHEKPFERADFSHDHLDPCHFNWLDSTIYRLNQERDRFNISEGKDKDAWWQMIQMLPSSYNQKRTVMLNYAVLKNIYEYRRNHKLNEWREFCEMIEKLPYAKELIIGGNKE